MPGGNGNGEAPPFPEVDNKEAASEANLYPALDLGKDEGKDVVASTDDAITAPPPLPSTKSTPAGGDAPALGISDGTLAWLATFLPAWIWDYIPALGYEELQMVLISGAVSVALTVLYFRRSWSGEEEVVYEEGGMPMGGPYDMYQPQLDVTASQAPGNMAPTFPQSATSSAASSAFADTPAPHRKQRRPIFDVYRSQGV